MKKWGPLTKKEQLEYGALRMKVFYSQNPMDDSLGSWEGRPLGLNISDQAWGRYQELATRVGNFPDKRKSKPITVTIGAWFMDDKYKPIMEG